MAAEPADIAEVIAGWNKGQRICRARQRHSWQPYTVHHHGTYYEVEEQCGQCRNRRYREMSLTGYWLTTWKIHRYGPGYLLPKGSGGLEEEERAELRLFDIANRKMIQAPEEDE